MRMYLSHDVYVRSFSRPPCSTNTIVGDADIKINTVKRSHPCAENLRYPGLLVVPDPTPSTPGDRLEFSELLDAVVAPLSADPALFESSENTGDADAVGLVCRPARTRAAKAVEIAHLSTDRLHRHVAGA